MLLVELFDVGCRSIGVGNCLVVVLGNGRSEVGSSFCSVGRNFNFLFVGMSYSLFCRVCRSLVLDATQCSSKFCVEVNEERHDFLSVVGLPELEVSAALQELTYTFGFLDAGHFDHDAAFLSFEGLDVRLYDTESVDTCAEHVVGVVDGALYLCAQHAFDFFVGALCCHLVAQLLCGEEFGESLVGLQCLVVLDE